jgi:hypothetical protein
MPLDAWRFTVLMLLGAFPTLTVPVWPPDRVHKIGQLSGPEPDWPGCGSRTREVATPSPVEVRLSEGL